MPIPVVLKYTKLFDFTCVCDFFSNLLRDMAQKIKNKKVFYVVAPPTHVNTILSLAHSGNIGSWQVIKSLKFIIRSMLD